MTEPHTYSFKAGFRVFRIGPLLQKSVKKVDFKRLNHRFKWVNMMLSQFCLWISLYFRVYFKMPQSIFQFLTDTKKPSLVSIDVGIHLNLSEFSILNLDTNLLFVLRFSRMRIDANPSGLLGYTSGIPCLLSYAVHMQLYCNW